jgi:Tfp pilus assembly protein PilO
VNAAWRPGQRMAAVWVPAVVVCLAMIAIYAWQTSGSVGREAQLRDETQSLENEVERLARIGQLAEAERDEVADLNRQFNYLYKDVFGDLEERLTRILRAVGAATREAGLLPGSFGYSATEDKQLDQVRFSIQFSVEGEYPQIRRLLAELQTSPEFLIVEHIGFSGEEDASTRNLQISLRLATVFAEADAEQLRRLTGGIRKAELDTNGTTADES